MLFRNKFLFNIKQTKELAYFVEIIRLKTKYFLSVNS